MVNRISLLSLVENKSAFISHAQKRIVESALPFFPETDGFVIYDSNKEMFQGLSKAFSTSNIVLAGVEGSLFLSFKRLLLQALNLESESNSKILDIISKSNEDVAESLSISHALVPKGASVFISEDGFFSGFATKSGKQYLAVLPLDPGRIDSIIENGFYDYLKLISAAEESPAVAPAAVVPVFNNENASKTVNILISNGLRVAVASTKTSVFIKNAFKDKVNYGNAFQFVDCDEKKNSLSQKEFIADLASRARENSSCPLGAAISNVFSSEKDSGRLFLFLTIADNQRARVAKVYGEPGETPRMLMEAAVDTLFNMLTDYAETGGFTGYPTHTDTQENPPEEVKEKKNLALKLILAGAAALVLCLAVIFLASKMTTDLKNKSKDKTEVTSIVFQRTTDATSELQTDISTTV